MQFKGLALVASAFVFVACGGGDSAPATDMAAAPAAAGPATMAPATGTTHEVKMVFNAASSTYAFEPANITIKTGDAIHFVAVSGFPHNVVFDGTTLVPAVKAQLDANFSAKDAELMSPMFVAAGEGVTISFANIPAGTYNFNCSPHLAMNMKGVVTVQ